jgi:predicted GNAT family acetyltransferase
MEPLTIINNEQRQQFQAIVEHELCSLEYRFSDGCIVLMHTEVPDKLSGKGIASALAAYAFDYARQHHMGVKVYCPFVVNWLRRHPEQQDVVVSPA